MLLIDMLIIFTKYFEKRSSSILLLQEGSPDILKPLMLSRQLLTVMFDGCFSRKRFISHHVIDLESVHAWLVSSSTKLWQKLYKVRSYVYLSLSLRLLVRNNELTYKTWLVHLEKMVCSWKCFLITFR